MKTKFISFFTLILLFSVCCFDLTGQKPTSIFESCSDLNSMSKINSCEKSTLMNFIYKEFLPYAKSARKSGADYDLWVFFNIESNGEIKEFEIKERAKSSFGKLMGIPLGTTYLPVKMEGFTGSKKYQVYSKLPENMIPDFNYEDLVFSAWGEEKEIFKIVEQMPRFPGCEEEKTENERDKCAKIKMMEYIERHLKYPEEAKIKKIQGQVVVQFVIEKDGSISEIKVARDIGFGCGQAAVDVVESWNEMAEKWRPGHQRGRPVVVLYTLPVKFKLED